MKVVGSSSNGFPKKVFFIQILVKAKLIKHHFKVVMEDNMEIMAKITNKKSIPFLQPHFEGV
jgi:hypothetical protein